jgi:hypothetical protein
MIKTTTNYNLFSLMEQNRNVDLKNKKAKNLALSMITYGWLSSAPLMAKQDGDRLLVIDGQHRLAIASEYGIPVKYVIETQDIDVAKLNDTSHAWTVDDYAKKHAKAGLEDYQELLDYSDRYGISVAMACGVLNSARSANGAAMAALRSGSWKIKNRTQAYRLANCYQRLCKSNDVFKKVNALKALWACMHIPYFDQDRLIHGAIKRSAELKHVTRLELFYEMFEDIYNYGRRDKQPLRFDAEQAINDRNPTIAKHSD